MNSASTEFHYDSEINKTGLNSEREGDGGVDLCWEILAHVKTLDVIGIFALLFI